MTYDLVAIGNPVYDEIVTPYGRTNGRVLSGCSTNACLAAKRLGLGKVAMIGCLGQDYEGRFREDMTKYDVELPRIKISEETGGFKLIYDDSGNRTLDVLGVSGKIFPEDIPEECLDAKIILLGPILQEIDLRLTEFLRRKSKAELFLDPQGIVREIGDDKRIREICERQKAEAFSKLVDIIKPNEHEAETLTGVEAPFVSARLLTEWGAKISIVTLAERGSIVYKGRNFLKIPAYKTTAKDPTGAGDTYAGAFIKRYLDGGNLLQIALFASAAASIKVEHTGPDFPLDIDEVNQRIQKIW
ncbi:MAG: Ribokinase [Thermoproteota archaeon]|nr:Ribokinase [Thermoproteota archaeon]